jgi:hypothetical protein
MHTTSDLLVVTGGIVASLCGLLELLSLAAASATTTEG